MSSKQEKAAYQRRWYYAHKEQCQAATKRWARNHPETVRAQRNAWAKRNKHRLRVYRKRGYACYTTERRMATYQRNKQNEKKIQRNCTLKRLYGIDETKYQEMLMEQNGVCAICSSPPKRKSLAVDHDHRTGKVRSLLCQSCNARLGVLEDRSWMENARIYLEKYA